MRDDEYPDLHNKHELVQAIANLQVLGGYARSYSEDGTPDRYIETLGDYVAYADIEALVARLFPNEEAA